jgi:ABC-type uncharacterized transport system substrate-binding protein
MPALRLICLLGLAVVAAGARAATDAPPTVAIVLSQELAPYQDAEAGIRDGLAALPFAVDVDVYQLKDDPQDQTRIATALRDRGTGLVFTIGTEAYRAFAPRVGDIPLVVTMVYDPQHEFDLDPVKDPHVYAANLRVPYAQQLTIFREYMPAIDKVAVICMSESDVAALKKTSAGAKNGDLEIVPIVLTDLKDLDQALTRVRSEAQALLMILDPSIYTTATTPKILLSCARSRIPVWSFSPNYVKAGALMSVSSSYHRNGITAAALAGDILQGRPVAQRYVPTNGILVAWNEHVAEALGIALPATRRQTADLVY